MGLLSCGSVLHECSMGVHHKLAHLLEVVSRDHSSTHTALLPFTLSLNLNLCQPRCRSASVPSLGEIRRTRWCDMGPAEAAAGTDEHTHSGFSSKAIDDIARKAEEQAQKSGTRTQGQSSARILQSC